MLRQWSCRWIWFFLVTNRLDYSRICIRIYAYWADAYYAYILVRIYLSCTVALLWKYFLEEYSCIVGRVCLWINLQRLATFCHSHYGIMFLLWYRSWCIKNLCYVNDLVDESGSFLSPTDLINRFNLKCTLLHVQAFGITYTGTIPASWKSEIRRFGKRLPVVKFQNIEGL